MMGENTGSGGLGRLGCVGLGIMGRPAALNLLKAGFSLTVWNRSDNQRLKEVLDAGAARAGSPREVAERSDVVFVNVTDSPDVEQVVLGEQGIIHGIRPGSVLVDMSTISPDVTRRIAALLKEKGVEMIDAPVSGGERG